jgi:hypothetical protein
VSVPRWRAMLVGLALCGCWPSADPEPQAASAEPAPIARPVIDLPIAGDMGALTEEDLERLTAFLVPYVEEAAGAKFREVPPSKIGSADSLREVMAEETRSVIGRIYDVPERVIEQLAASAVASVPALLGKYAPATGAVYLVTSNLAGQDSIEAVRLAALVMAHELAHALQDQVADLGHLFEVPLDYEHFEGLRGITEGHANWVTRRVAIALGIEDAFWAMSRHQGWGPDGVIDPGAFSVFMLYGQGMFFCDHHAKDRGAEALWEIVRVPPRTTTDLFRPARYGTPVEVPDLKGVLAGVENTLTAGIDWVPADTVLGEGTLRADVAGLPNDRVEDLFDRVKWGYEQRMFSGGGPSAGPRKGSVRIIQFGSAVDAKAMVGLLSEGMEAQARARTEVEAKMAGALPGVVARTWSVDVKAYDRVEGDAVVLRVVGPLTASGARSSSEEEQALWVVRGARLVVVAISGFRPGNRLDRAIEQVFVQLGDR